jgi:rhomboid protease GluP
MPGIGFGKRICKWCEQYEAAKRGEVPDDAMQPVMDVPWVRRASGPIVTHAIFGINVAVFLGMALAGVDIMRPAGPQLVHWGSNFTQATLSGQWWRLVTYMFVHIGIIHIALNMWCFWNLGELAESLYGHVMFALVYLLCGVGAGVASLAWHAGVNSAGASGAIFGIAGALIASLKLGDFSMPAAHVKATLSSIVTFAVYNIAFGAVTGFTDNAAHVGGLAVGLILGGLIALAAPQRRQYAGRVLILVLVSALVAGGAAWTKRSKGYMVHVQRAYALMAESKIDEAIGEMQAAVRQRPNLVDLRVTLAWMYQMKGRYADAERELRSVLERNPSDLDALYQLGDMYDASGQLQKAKDTFNRMLAINLKSSAAHYGLGAVLRHEDNCAAAIEEYKAAAKIEPGIGDVYYYIGNCYAHLKSYDDAIAAYKQQIKSSGDSHDVEVALANAYNAKGMTEEAEDATAKAAKLNNQASNDTTP